MSRMSAAKRGPGGSVEVRYFAAARAAAGQVKEERVILPFEEATREQFAALLVSLHPEPPAGEPSLEQVLAQSTLLADGTALASDEDRVRPGMRVDVLPPFAGG
ncbi:MULTISPECIES: MoaD/ThiS family protein [Brevibacterium]|uniref:MoaD/ThiS family protein n=1 Tax=Brevibacterium salitolerans TaxID=1403566 RepID=A0ABP5I8F7_9MICO|nr:MoaD/ThiS family protein [Brevibacterium sp.]